MKISIILILSLILCTSCQGNTIFGKIKMNKEWNNTVYIYKMINLKIIGKCIDSATTDKNGNYKFVNLPTNTILLLFVLKKEMFEPIMIDNFENNNYLPIVLSKGNKIKLDFEIDKLYYSAKFNNYAGNNLFKFFQNNRLSLRNIFIKEKQNASKTGNFDKLKEIIFTSAKSYFLELIEKNKTISKNNKIEKILLLTEFNQFEALFPDEHRKNLSIFFIEDFSPFKLEYLVKNQIDLIGRSFEFDSLRDSIKKLNINFENKDSAHYIIAFWASWCGPCRKSNKFDLLQISKTFKNIQIIGLSIDDKIEDWKKAVIQDNIKWATFLLNDKEKLQSSKYINKGIPSYVILDKNFKVIGIYNNIVSVKNRINQLVY